MQRKEHLSDRNQKVVERLGKEVHVVPLCYLDEIPKAWEKCPPGCMRNCTPLTPEMQSKVC